LKHLTQQLLRGPSSLGGRLLVNTGALAGANLWRIVVSFLVQLLVGRALGLDALGQYTVAMAYLNISQVLCEMGLPLWMIRKLAQTPHLRRTYFRRGVLLQVTAALLLWAILAAVATWLPYPPSTRTAIFWVGASLPLFAITSATATIFQSAERMTLALVIEFVTNLLILLMSIWLLWQGQGVDDLLLVVVIAQGIGMMVGLGLLLASGLLGGQQNRASMPLREVVAQAMPFFGLSLSDVLLQRLDILLLSFLGDARLLGIYSAAYNLVRVAVKLLQSVWRGVYPTLARLYLDTPERANALAARLLRLGLIACTVGALLVAFLSTPILRLVYDVEGGINTTGINGVETSFVLALLIWQAPLFFLELYATTLFMVRQRAGVALALIVGHVLLLALLLPVGATLFGAIGAAWGTIAAQAVAAAVSLWLTVRYRPLQRV
jgi:O-antigen/teichoic acid export membrane protein